MRHTAPPVSRMLALSRGCARAARRGAAACPRGASASEVVDARARGPQAPPRTPPWWRQYSGVGAPACRSPTALASPPQRRFASLAAAAAVLDGDADAPLAAEVPAGSSWVRFLSYLHAKGYFAAQAGESHVEAGGETVAPAAAAAAEFSTNAKGLVTRFGSPGDHKRAVFAYARERERSLAALPAGPLRALAATPVPQAALDGVFGGRKTTNAVKRLRVALRVGQRDVAPGCAVERTPHAAQGEAALPDAVRLLLTFATTRLPPDAAPPQAAVDALLHALTTMPPDASAPAAAERTPVNDFAARSHDADGVAAGSARRLAMQRRATDAAVHALTSAQRSAASEAAFLRKCMERQRPLRVLADDGAPPPPRRKFRVEPPRRERSPTPRQQKWAPPPLRTTEGSPAFSVSFLPPKPRDAAPPPPPPAVAPAPASTRTYTTSGGHRSQERPPRSAAPSQRSPPSPFSASRDGGAGSRAGHLSPRGDGQGSGGPGWAGRDDRRRMQGREERTGMRRPAPSPPRAQRPPSPDADEDEGGGGRWSGLPR